MSNNAVIVNIRRSREVGKGENTRQNEGNTSNRNLPFCASETVVYAQCITYVSWSSQQIKLVQREEQLFRSCLIGSLSKLNSPDLSLSKVKSSICY